MTKLQTLFALQLHRLLLLLSFTRTSLMLCITTVLTQKMKTKRFVFHIPNLNIFRPIHATSIVEARHLLMNSDLAPYYGQAVLLTADD